MKFSFKVALGTLLISLGLLAPGHGRADDIDNGNSGSMVVSFASDCGDDEDLQNFPPSTSADDTPKWIRRVYAPLSGDPLPPAYTGSKRVWIIDSGVATSSSIVADLNFADDPATPGTAYKRLCTADDCNTRDTETDFIGHGTMIAGLIGAKVTTVALGLRGVAPGVRLISLKIFDKTLPADFGEVALTALRHVEANAVPNDIVNISWGMRADWRQQSVATAIEKKLRDLARLGLFVVVAAGNTDVIGGSGYVQTISPARAGGFRVKDTTSGVVTGGIFTISAVRTRGNPGNWRDRFWRFSAFGNGSGDSSVDQPGPPDYAAPGVQVDSYWPDATGTGKINTCSGTSFSAAIVSGLMVWGIPRKGGKSAWDPSAIKPGVAFPGDGPGPTYYFTTFSDPVAIK